MLVMIETVMHRYLEKTRGTGTIITKGYKPQKMYIFAVSMKFMNTLESLKNYAI